ncbi:type I restriction endonuclease [Acidobacteria bacterium AH-259-D05]|nr:type I restriction endonuclease [Acidobacteria bacterium AH-259-D05]
MIEQLKSFIETLRTNPRLNAFDEAATKQAIILPLLHQLGWNTYNIDEVTPEFSVENRRVDYSLRLNNTNEVFLEIKKAGEDLERFQEQLLDYSFRQGVELAVLTNGKTWWFYLPTKKGDWKTRKFYTIDLIQQEPEDVVQRFIDLLSRNTVQTGKALQHAESIYKGKQKKKLIEETIPEAWNKIITEPDSLLIDLLSETTENICGFKPETDETTRFLKTYEGRFLLSPEEEPPVGPPKAKTQQPPILESKKISQDDLIPHIVKVLQKHGGRARKPQVEEEIYQMFKDIFKEQWYQETVSNGVPRWQHNIAWAKERAKRKGLIKRPKDSGRGYWELTSSGLKMSF